MSYISLEIYEVIGNWLKVLSITDAGAESSHLVSNGMNSELSEASGGQISEAN